MSIQNPIGGGGPQDPYDKYRKYRVEPVNRETDDEERKKFEGQPPQKPLPSGSFLFVLIHRMVNYFLSLAGHSQAAKSEKEVAENLSLLKTAFETLKFEDRSQDVEFLEHLSGIWHQALENSMRFKRTDSFSMGFRSFTKKIQNYPEGQEHTLGYYLTEYTGEKWLPFPYMELIQTIHEQYQNDPTTSPLAEWLLQLDELIATLKPPS